MSSTGSRRDFLAHAAAGGACLLTFTVAGCARKLTPAQARDARVPYRTLASNEVRTVESLGETLLPGSAAAGLAHYLDHQLSGSPADSMLMIKYLGVAPPFTEFYRTGLQALDAAAHASHKGRAFADLTPQQAQALVNRISAGQVTGWWGCPP